MVPTIEKCLHSYIIRPCSFTFFLLADSVQNIIL